MKKKILRNILIVSFAAFILAGCAMGPRAESVPGLSADDNAAYVSYLSALYKVDLNSGKELWRYPVQRNAQVVLYAPAMVFNDGVFVGDLANKFHKLNLEDGSEEWTFTQAKGWFQAKAVTNGTAIIAPGTDRNVYALDIQGNLLWKYSNDFGFLAEPLISDDTVYISAMDHFLIALDINDGEVIWKNEQSGSLVAAPIFDSKENLLYAGNLGKEFVAINPSSGETVWRFDDNGNLSSVWSSPILLDNQLLFTDEGGKIFSLDPATGKENWRIETNGETLAGLAAVNGGFLAVTQDGSLRAYDLERRSLWTATLEGELNTTPVVVGDTILVAITKGDALLVAYNQSGTQIWTFKPEN